MTRRPLTLDGVLFFPVTPFRADGDVDEGVLADHVAERVAQGAGGVFPACGTGEFHALSLDEVRRVVTVAVDAVGGAVPVIAGAGGPLGHAVACARAAAEAGADAVLILPPYLVQGPADGLVAYVESILDASGLPGVVYHRATSQYSPAVIARLLQDQRVIGFKDGTGDVGLAQEIVRTVADSGRDDFLLFNGLLTAELTQGAYRGIGMPLYSSAAFAMAPSVASAYHSAYVRRDEDTRLALLDGFYRPLVRLRDETPGFGVSLIKAGLRIADVDVGSVRAPLVDPTAEQTARLAAVLAAGQELVDSRSARSA